MLKKNSLYDLKWNAFFDILDIYFCFNKGYRRKNVLRIEFIVLSFQSLKKKYKNADILNGINP